MHINFEHLIGKISKRVLLVIQVSYSVSGADQFLEFGWLIGVLVRYLLALEDSVGDSEAAGHLATEHDDTCNLHLPREKKV